VNADTVKQLLNLNQQFYQTFAPQFSATRMRLQPGVRRILDRLPPRARILDLGCGNGELWRALKGAGNLCAYTGLDSSVELLEIAAVSQETSTQAAQAVFIQADITTPDWEQRLPQGLFDVILAFAVLHHIPSDGLRLQILRKVNTLLTLGGVFVHSEWQFLNSARLRARIQPWEAIGLRPADVELGDYLLDWRRGGHGLRYVHHFSQAELVHLAAVSGFQILETFQSDGEDGRLGLYQIWKPTRTPL
jgi:SAM-dependent methyltransferase